MHVDDDRGGNASKTGTGHVSSAKGAWQRPPVTGNESGLSWQLTGRGSTVEAEDPRKDFRAAFLPLDRPTVDQREDLHHCC